MRLQRIGDGLSISSQQIVTWRMMKITRKMMAMERGFCRGMKMIRTLLSSLEEMARFSILDSRNTLLKKPMSRQEMFHKYQIEDMIQTRRVSL
jgi:hypothetical protein